ncbi:hypothetical protein IV203_033565 [Nitzschia inconspicua]|uniref:Uncharacterized protein n=1 Tax=Nitzschia inconspicua TaxID=303405 RepID=A0A9K3M674_9STRA|nr:hypothetical protein IV203_033565 [Nitzschia inconspicua]
MSPITSKQYYACGRNKGLLMLVFYVFGQLFMTKNHVLAQSETTGFGCYNLSNNQCNCEESVCNQQSCEAIGGIWTDGCVSCQCETNNSDETSEQGGDEDATNMEGAEDDLEGVESSEGEDVVVDDNDEEEETAVGEDDEEEVIVDESEGEQETAAEEETAEEETAVGEDDEAEVIVDESEGEQETAVEEGTAEEEVIVDDSDSLEVAGFACYNLPMAGLQCTCTDDVCSESACTEQGGIWTDRCSSCTCGDIGRNDPNSTADSEEADAGFGCYSLPDAPMRCTCSEEFCDEDLCLASNGTWTDQCTSCTCSGGNNGSGDDGDPTTGWGCYDISVNRCGCAPEFCSQDLCENAGGIFTDGCGSCQCAETFTPGGNTVTFSPTTAVNANPTSPPTFSPVGVTSATAKIGVPFRTYLLEGAGLVGFSLLVML